MCCPHCGSINVIKNGRHQNGRQKYRCKDCKKIFGDTNGTFLYRSKLTLEQWQEFVYLTMCNVSLPMTDIKQVKAVWNNGEWEGNIAGEISKVDLLLMIDSIYK